MKFQKYFPVALSFLLLYTISCSKKNPNYKPDTLALDILFSISGDVDTEDSTRTFSEIEDMDIDSDGNIYLLNSRKGKILKFNDTGDFITSFGSLGKEPGQFLSLDLVIIEDTVYVKSFPNKKIVKFDDKGNYIETFDYRNEGLFKGVIGEILRSVSDDKIVGYMHNVEDNRKGQLLFRHNLALMNKKFEEIAVLRDYQIEFDPYNIRYFESISKFTSGGGKIYVAENNEDKYAIDVFDLEGKKIHKISHDYSKIEYNHYEQDKIKTMNLRANGNLMTENKSYKKSINDLFYDKYNRLIVCPSIERDSTNQNDFIIDMYKDDSFISRSKIQGLTGEDFVSRFDSKIYFLGDKIYELVNGKSKLNIYTY